MSGNMRTQKYQVMLDPFQEDEYGEFMPIGATVVDNQNETNTAYWKMETRVGRNGKDTVHFLNTADPEGVVFTPLPRNTFNGHTQWAKEAELAGYTDKTRFLETGYTEFFGIDGKEHRLNNAVYNLIFSDTAQGVWWASREVLRQDKKYLCLLRESQVLHNPYLLTAVLRNPFDKKTNQFDKFWWQAVQRLPEWFIREKELSKAAKWYLVRTGQEKWEPNREDLGLPLVPTVKMKPHIHWQSSKGMVEPTINKAV